MLNKNSFSLTILSIVLVALSLLNIYYVTSLKKEVRRLYFHNKISIIPSQSIEHNLAPITNEELLKIQAEIQRLSKEPIK